MTRPRKRTVFCRSIGGLRVQRRGRESSDSDDSSTNDDCIELLDDCTAEGGLRTVDEALQWVESANCRSRAPYHGASRRTLFRRQSEKKRRLDSAKGSSKITDFFQASRSCEYSLLNSELSIEEAIDKLKISTRNIPNAKLQCNLQKNSNEWEFMCLLAVRQYFHRINEEIGKIKVSEEIAKFLFPERSFVHQGRLIRHWAKHYLSYGFLPERQQGRFVKIRSLIQDEDVQRILQIYIRSESENALTSCSLAQWVKENLHLKIYLTAPVIISEKTAQRWLKILGLKYGRYRPGIYNDGHERSDVVAYREQFLHRFEEYERRMIQYEGDFMEKVVPPVLLPNERPLILVTHDESCFSAHDGRNYVWLDEGSKPIRPKGDGRSVMVSALLCECHGLLRLSDEQKSQHPEILEATVIIKPGANAEGYWRNADLVKQLVGKAFPIFRILHPDCDGLFTFDNSQNHHAKPPDALTVNVLNLKDGGKNARPMRDGWFVDENGQRMVQSMHTSNGTLKGLKTILTERGLWPAESLSRDAARKLLSSQPDFSGQMEWLEEVVTEAGFQVDFYPKYHCEFNYIEMFWGAAKAYSRKHCTYSFTDLIQVVPRALETVPLSSIRKFARKSYRYIDAYRVRGDDGNSLTPKQIEYAVKKYRQHRKIPVRILLQSDT